MILGIDPDSIIGYSKFIKIWIFFAGYLNFALTVFTVFDRIAYQVAEYLFDPYLLS